MHGFERNRCRPGAALRTRGRSKQTNAAECMIDEPISMTSLNAKCSKQAHARHLATTCYSNNSTDRALPLLLAACSSCGIERWSKLRFVFGAMQASQKAIPGYVYRWAAPEVAFSHSSLMRVSIGFREPSIFPA